MTEPEMGAGEDDVLVAVRVQDMDNPVAGSVRRRCSVCDVEVWVSPASVELLQQYPLVPVMCLADAQQYVEEHDG